MVERGVRRVCPQITEIWQNSAAVSRRAQIECRVNASFSIAQKAHCLLVALLRLGHGCLMYSSILQLQSREILSY